MSVERPALKLKLTALKFLVVWCVYPSLAKRAPPFPTTDLRKCTYQKNEVSCLKTLLRQEIRAPGESIVFGKFLLPAM